MAHLVAFYPDRAGSLQAARGLADGGCSWLEVQFPFSDPTADGPDIQAACARALESGFTVETGFQLLAEICTAVEVPVFVMSYANLLFTRGVGRFLEDCRTAGAHGVIVPDLPPDYDEGLYDRARALGLAAVPVLSPSISAARLSRAAALDTEFIYATLRAGTTGSRTNVDEATLGFLRSLATLRGARPAKIVGGFGIASREQVRALEPHVHGVIVGSALVREIAKGGDPYEAVRKKMRELAGP
jgi:tryptophan synthase alpha chain